MAMQELMRSLPKPFWVVWGIEFWERFGYYGCQALLALFFVHHIGMDESTSYLVFGSFSAFVYGFVWVGGYIGDHYLGAKRTVILGGLILMLSYFSLFFATNLSVFYSLGGIIVGNALFKANPSSLISKMYDEGDPALDSAMTMYYMAINIGSFIALIIAPIIAHQLSFQWAFFICSLGLFVGIAFFLIFYRVLRNVSTAAGDEKLYTSRLMIVIGGSIIATAIIGTILTHTWVCYSIVGIVSIIGFGKFIQVAFTLDSRERKRMLVAFILLLQAIVFFTLYNQMPTTLTFLAKNNIDYSIFGWHLPPAIYQSLNPLVIIIMSPILAVIYQKSPGTHVTKFCLGMTSCGLAFLVLWLPQFFTETGMITPWWLVITYWFQSTGELLISGLGLAMVAELCPRDKSGFVMGIWFITSMIAGPVGAFVGHFTTPDAGTSFTPQQSIQAYGDVFGIVGLVVMGIAFFMWISRPALVRIIDNPGEKDEFSEHVASLKETQATLDAHVKDSNVPSNAHKENKD